MTTDTHRATAELRAQRERVDGLLKQLAVIDGRIQRIGKRTGKMSGKASGKGNERSAK